MGTIRMAFVPEPIDTNHDNMFKFKRILSMTAYLCIVCGNEDEENLVWHSLMPRMHNIFSKHQDDPYRALL